MFPIGQTMRANFFCYHDFRDPWLKQFRAAPMATIFEASPRLRRFLPGTAEVISDVRVRPTDLYVARNHEQPGVVLIGDNFSTSCPAAGTGLNKVLTDVERLCNHYIPVWLASPRMGVDKIHRYYQDPIKRDCDKYSTRLAFYTRSVSIDTTFPWRMRRLLGTGLTIKGHFQKQPA
jgi:2-polyprenyl-6-methoxyphenol hydroxylase-like FAD-dependent oxidoreductase